MSTDAHATLHVNDQTFDTEALASDKPVLVDFHAGWCPPCRALAPTIDDLAADYAGRAVVAKVDVDESPELARRYGVQSIPTVLLFKNGEILGKRVGLAPKADLAALIDDAIG